MTQVARHTHYEKQSHNLTFWSLNCLRFNTIDKGMKMLKNFKIFYESPNSDLPLDGNYPHTHTHAHTHTRMHAHQIKNLQMEIYRYMLIEICIAFFFSDTNQKHFLTVLRQYIICNIEWVEVREIEVFWAKLY